MEPLRHQGKGWEPLIQTYRKTPRAEKISPPGKELAGPSPTASNPLPRRQVGPSSRVLAAGTGSGGPARCGRWLRPSMAQPGRGLSWAWLAGRALSMVPAHVCEAGRRSRTRRPQAPAHPLGGSLTACSRRRRCHRSPGRGRTRAPPDPRSRPCPRCRRGRPTWGGRGAATAAEGESADGKARSAALSALQRPQSAEAQAARIYQSGPRAEVLKGARPGGRVRRGPAPPQALANPPLREGPCGPFNTRD